MPLSPASVSCVWAHFRKSPPEGMAGSGGFGPAQVWVQGQKEGTLFPAVPVETREVCNWPTWVMCPIMWPEDSAHSLARSVYMTPTPWRPRDSCDWPIWVMGPSRYPSHGS